ncbi:hypothetical protein [Piscinibacter koreensis]|uniref:Uncharacterized protein n=1 Tax=Piscinibacter koreensis TaxID=2742824 RepID=A0A7Y6NJN2_9BURK|nr:hypothetical protein [Schlegelella koreensis]NUZ04410.1 hypothetical protein [Schlegelella koreensis]
MNIYAVSKVRLDEDGRVTGVEWGPVDIDARWQADPVVSDVAEVVAALQRGDRVVAMFETPEGLEPGRTFRVVTYDNGWETVALDGEPTYEHELHDMARVPD